ALVVGEARRETADVVALLVDLPVLMAELLQAICGAEPSGPGAQNDDPCHDRDLLMRRPVGAADTAGECDRSDSEDSLERRPGTHGGAPPVPGGSWRPGDARAVR